MKPFSSIASFVKGIEFVSPTGEIINFGCKTLKNVAGYDLSQFMIGSFGKFGVITSFLLKLNTSMKQFYRPGSVKENCLSEFNDTENALYNRIKKEIDPNNVLI